MAPHLNQYMRMFGIVGGLTLYAKAKYRRKELRINVPGLPESLALRGGTSDRSTFQKVFLERAYDLDLDFTPRLIIDGGANVGYASVYFAHRFPDALILAVEPEPKNFLLLTSNTNAYPNIRCFNHALWPRRTYLSLENSSGNTDAFFVREASNPIIPQRVMSISIPELLAYAPIDSIDILKLDIEGAEKELFQDEHAQNWIARTRALIVEFHDRFKPGCTEAALHAIAGYGFRLIERGESLIFLR